MIELAILLIILVIVICIKINRLTKTLAAKERAFIEEHRMFQDTIMPKISRRTIALNRPAYGRKDTAYRECFVKPQYLPENADRSP